MPAPRGIPRARSHSMLGRMAAATMNAKKSSAISSRSFQSASAATTTPTTIRVETRTRRIVLGHVALLSAEGPLQTAGKPRVPPKPRPCDPTRTRRSISTRVSTAPCWRARSRARRVLVLLGVAALLVPFAPAAVVGALLIAAGAFFTLRAVWQWERTHLVVTTEKVYLLNGTLHRRAKAVRLQAVDAVEIDQSLVGQLFGYGTVVVGPLTVGHIAHPNQVCRLVERLAS